MSIEVVKKFYEAMSEDKGTESELAKAISENNILEFAKEKGYEFTKEDHDEFLSGVEIITKELSDEQLEDVTGGFNLPGVMLVKIICVKCGWSTDWLPIHSYTNYGALTAVHTAAYGHTKYGAQYR